MNIYAREIIQRKTKIQNKKPNSRHFRGVSTEIVNINTAVVR